MSKSLISDEKECWRCGATSQLHKHHIFPGAARKSSEKYGCWVYLCGKHHNLSLEGVHFDRKFDNDLRKLCQAKFEEKYGHDKFMEVFHRNLL